MCGLFVELIMVQTALLLNAPAEFVAENLTSQLEELEQLSLCGPPGDQKVIFLETVAQSVVYHWSYPVNR
jgi:hypothetical protein